MKDLTEEALGKITGEYWKKCYDHMIKELLYYMQNDGLIPKPTVVTPPDPESNREVEVNPDEVQCSKPNHFCHFNICRGCEFWHFLNG